MLRFAARIGQITVTRNPPKKLVDIALQLHYQPFLPPYVCCSAHSLGNWTWLRPGASSSGKNARLIEGMRVLTMTLDAAER